VESPSALRSLWMAGVGAVIELDDGVVWPERLADLVAQHHLPGVAQQHEKDTEGLLMKPDLDAALAQLGGANVQFEWTETNRTRRRNGPVASHRCLVPCYPRSAGRGSANLPQPPGNHSHSP